MTFQVRDCSRQVRLLNFIEKQKSGLMNSGFYRRRYFRKERTDDELIEMRHYMIDDAKPLFYRGPCEAPQKVKARGEEVMREYWTFPTITAETDISCADIDEKRITPQGTLIRVSERLDREVMRRVARDLIEPLSVTMDSEAVHLIRNAGYAMRTGKAGDADILGYMRVKRADPVSDAHDGDAFCWDFSEPGATAYSGWCSPCAKPFKQLEMVMQHMGKCGARGSVVDMIHSNHAWCHFESHSEREGMKYSMNPPLGNAFEQSLITSYNDVVFKGQTTHGGVIINHFVDNSEHWTFDLTINDWVLTPTLNPGEVLIINREAFAGTTLCNVMSPGGFERLPDDAPEPFFLYDDPTDAVHKVFDAKCEIMTPWIRARHLQIPRNVNAAQLMKVVLPEKQPCSACEVCPPITTEETP